MRCVATAPVRSPTGPCSAWSAESCCLSPDAMFSTSSNSQWPALREAVPCTTTASGRPDRGETKCGRTIRTPSLAPLRFNRTQSEAWNSSITLVGPSGNWSRNIDPLVASITNRSPASPRWAAAAARSWPVRRGLQSASASDQSGRPPSNPSSRSAARAAAEAIRSRQQQASSRPGRTVDSGKTGMKSPRERSPRGQRWPAVDSGEPFERGLYHRGRSRLQSDCSRHACAACQGKRILIFRLATGGNLDSALNEC